MFTTLPAITTPSRLYLPWLTGEFNGDGFYPRHDEDSPCLPAFANQPVGKINFKFHVQSTVYFTVKVTSVQAVTAVV
jgi:hypothetical protein